MGGDCIFNDSFCDKEEFKSWLRRDTSDKRKGRCIACNVSFKIGRMGMKSSIGSHASSARHKENIKRQEKSAASAVVPITEFLKSPAMKDVQTPAPSSVSSVGVASANAAQSKLSFFKGDAQLNAEILWVMKAMTSHYSFRSFVDTASVFRLMFPDSDLAGSFQCSETKARYLTCFGILSYLKERLQEDLDGKDFVLLFDESLNNKPQKKQLDVPCGGLGSRPHKQVL